MLDGRYLFEVDGRRFTADVGDAAAAPGGSAHAFVNVNVTDTPARQFIQILSRLDATTLFLGLGDVMRDGKADQDALNAFGKRWHVELLGPPLTMNIVPASAEWEFCSRRCRSDREGSP